jgi:hypothetical protein
MLWGIGTLPTTQAFVPGSLFSAISQPAVGSSIPWSAERFLGVVFRGRVVVVVVF